MSVKAYIPYPKYVPISITGTSCSLNCRYCNKEYLRHMYQVLTPQRLYWLLKHLYNNGVRGFLISGGFTPEGKLPFHAYLSVIREFKRTYEVVISIHPGLIDVNEARMLREAKIDIVDLEFTLNPTYTSMVKGLGEKAVKKYEETLNALMRYGPSYIAPHVMVGSSLGLLGNEFSEIDYLIDYNPYVIVVLIYTPTKNTASENDPIPKVNYVLGVLKYLRQRYRGEISLGCMRPWGSYRAKLDRIALENKLIDRIANPHLKLIEEYDLRIVNACCSLPKEYEYLFT